ncbi:hypothetical protein FIV42_19910 [Persicimonas caeni]|uniref:Uncharacterized protein n=1 Tax=Persicimonas caeni TaxID=2292766 RepID=A0A4Y6PX66_PERCE|nr:hypothetical protein [Persicimonas caeni]QDG52924.1 hypothetical protein FIV42_19910 [Persicimonas caeni]QED34146.1 hypothetical protein FRD00_19905 [Persicimonas caeni]
MPITELDSGPFEIRLRDDASDARVGYTWVEHAEGSSTSYYVLLDKVPLPLPYGPTVIFEPVAMSGVDNSKAFLEWVHKNGELGPDIHRAKIQENYEPWEE